MATKRGGMRTIGDAAAGETDAELAREEAELLLRTATQLSALRPRVTDKAAFDQLIQVVQTSTAKMEDAAALRDRITALGEGTIKVAKLAAGLLA